MAAYRYILGALAAACCAYGTVINFESPLPAGLTSNSTYAAGGGVEAAAQLTNQYQSVGVLFNTIGGAGYAALINLGAGHATSGTNGIGPVASTNTLDYTLVLDIFFVVPGTNTPAVTGNVAISGDQIPIPGNLNFSAYDVNGGLLASGTAPDTAGGVYSLTAAGIHEFRISSTSGTVAYDDLTFGTPVAPRAPSSPDATPEPASIVLTGIGLLGAAVRYARTRAQA